MKVLKFGGTSIGTPERMQNVARLIAKVKGSKFVILSAISQTTNTLERINHALKLSDFDFAESIRQELEQHYQNYITGLNYSSVYKTKALEYLKMSFETITALFSEDFDAVCEKKILMQGELLSTHLMLYYCQDRAVPVTLVPALSLLKTDKQGEPDLDYLTEALKKVVSPADTFYLTQGYICLDYTSKVNNLGRGGSDYTACLLGAALQAKDIQIWTDIDGMHNNDPRYVENTRPVHQLSFGEAEELAYFGAKILHPTCILPAEKASIPVRLRSTMNPSAQGTTISNHTDSRKGQVKAIAAKSNITVVQIRSRRMLLAYGFLKKIFEVFDTYKTAIDMISTSEVALSLTIDDTDYLREIVKDLNPLGKVTVFDNQVIICIVGQYIKDKVGIEAEVFAALKDIPIQMVSIGASNSNISILVAEEHKAASLKQLNKHIFGLE